MAIIVGVHGIAQQLEGPNTLRDAWLSPLRDGLAFAGGPAVADDALGIVSWGQLFRQPGRKAAGVVPYTVDDLEDDLEGQLLLSWWAEAAAVESDVLGPDAGTKARTPLLVQRALHQLSGSRFFSALAEPMLIGSLKQVRIYLTDARVRRSVRDQVAAVVDSQTRVVVGHSLGSVVAYEALCAHPEWQVGTLVTVGSPLGIPNVIFDRLDPSPVAGQGVWPGSVRTWVNLADGGDVVALRKDLSPLFGGRVRDQLVHNGARAHDIGPYLTAKECGEAIAAGLA